jgi:hypothetical protein
MDRMASCEDSLGSAEASSARKEAMTDTITRARKEWCEPPVSETTITHYGTKIIATPKGSSCPPSVIAALLDVLDNMLWTIDTLFLPDDVEMQQTAAHVAAAKAAITRALEGK